MGNSCAAKEHWGGLVHHLSSHHCWCPALKTRKTNKIIALSHKIIALSQGFWEHSSSKFVLLAGTSGNEKVKEEEETGKWQEGWWSWTTHTALTMA